MALARTGDYLGMLSSTVAHPYRKTMTPTREAGISICVYRPNQAKYRAIFSPKYFLNETKISRLISSEHGQNEQMLVWGGTSVLTAQVQWVGTWRRRCSWPTLHTEAEHNQIQTILIQTMISADFTNREGRMSLKTGVFSPFCHWTLCSLHLCLPIKEKRIPMKPKENWKKWVKCEEVEEFRKYLHHEEDKMPCRRRCRAGWWFLGRGKWEFRACTSHCTRLVCVALVPEGKQFVEKKQSKSLDY